jgi:hypothetical protein
MGRLKQWEDGTVHAYKFIKLLLKKSMLNSLVLNISVCALPLRRLFCLFLRETEEVEDMARGI